MNIESIDDLWKQTTQDLNNKIDEDYFWKQMLQDLNNTTDDEWSQFIKDYENKRKCKPMNKNTNLCEQILQLIEDLDKPSFLRFDDVTIVSQFGEYDCYGDKCSDMFSQIYVDEDLKCFIDKSIYYGVHYEVYDRELNTQWFLQHIIKLLKLRLERNKHE